MQLRTHERCRQSCIGPPAPKNGAIRMTKRNGIQQFPNRPFDFARDGCVRPHASAMRLFLHELCDPGQNCPQQRFEGRLHAFTRLHHF